MFRKNPAAQAMLKHAQKAAPSALRNLRPPTMPGASHVGPFGQRTSVFDIAGKVMRSVFSPELMHDIDALKKEASKAVARSADARDLLQHPLGNPSSVGEQMVNSQRTLVADFTVATKHGPGRLRVKGEGPRGEVRVTAVELEAQDGRVYNLLRRD
mmetsp:Transcript_46086/g.109113  ORF Transcript_46086/g.109113 Transcript_46086/m.109113 type:complete len:156 (-) Transcript_46086:9-476(-)